MSKNASVSLGQHLKSLRKQNNMTQIEMSKRSGLSKSYISFLESDLRHPSRDVVLKLVKIWTLTADLRDALLIKAGYAPLQAPSEKNTTKSEYKPLPQAFGAFMQRVLEFIRQGEHALAQEAIEAGFQRYARPAEMQTLLAHLELSKNNFAHAVLSQETALKHAEMSGVESLEYGLNLGVMHFLWGDHFLFEGEQAEQAIEHYQKALSYYEAGLRLEPTHLYLLDESARVHFNLADLMTAQPGQAMSHWKSAKQAFRGMLAHPDNHRIKPQERMISVAFFALACAKLSSHHEASLVLDTLQTLQETDWLVDYIHACALCLRYTDTQDEAQNQRDASLTRARTLLTQAIKKNPDALEQARLDKDKDLAPLQKDPEISLLLQETSHA